MARASRWVTWFAVAAPVAAIAYYIALHWTAIDYGLSFPGRVGDAADHFFHNGQRTEPAFAYSEFSLSDGTRWKAVEASVHGEQSIPSWLICIIQGPEQKTYRLEQRFNDANRAQVIQLLEIDAQTSATQAPHVL
ncbi:MAG: hypothetical protein ACQKBV_01580, partial [Puniceicoccales bacterium]